jgi:hypothetical protein
MYSVARTEGKDQCTSVAFIDNTYDEESTLLAKSARTHTDTSPPRQVKAAREFASRLTWRDGAKTSTSVVPVFIYK